MVVGPLSDSLKTPQGQQQAQADAMGTLLDAFGGEMSPEQQMAKQRAADRDRVMQLRIEFEWARRERQKYVQVWNEVYHLYRSQVPDERRSGEWRSKLNVPHVWNAVETAVPHLMEGLWGSERPFRLDLANDDKLIEAHEKLLYWELNELNDGESIWEEGQRQKALYGTTAYYCGFRAEYDQQTYWKVQPSLVAGGETTKVLVTEKMPRHVGTTIEVLDIYTLYPHPQATRDRMRWVFWERWLTREELKRYFPDKEPMVADNAAVDAPRIESTVGERFLKTGSANSSSNGAQKLFHVLTKYDEESKRCTSFLYDQDVMLEDTDYPFFHRRCPIVFDRVTNPPKEFWGVGFPEMILSLAHEQNTIRNQRRDNGNLTANAIFEIRQGALDDEEEELEFAPGTALHTRTGQDIRAIQMPQVPESWREEAVVQQDIAATTGLSGPVAGQPAEGVDSASGTSLLQKAQLLRLKRAIRNSALAFKEVISQWLALNEQFLPLDEVFQVLGPLHFKDYSPLKITSLASRSNVVVMPAGIYEDEAVVRQQTINLMNILGANPLFAQEVDWNFMLREVIRRHGFQDTAMVLKKPQGIDIMQAMFASEENQMMAAGQPVPPAGPEDDYDVHMEAHRQLVAMRPDRWQEVGQHMVSHDAIKMMQAQMQAQQQMQAMAGQGAPPPMQTGGGPDRPHGPGSNPAGAQGGGVNPARQPQASGALGMKRARARMQP